MTTSEQPAALRPATMRFTAIASILAAVLLAFGLILTGASLLTSNDFKRVSDQSITLMESMRDHMTADMLHDGLRGVVFRAMYAGLGGDAAMLKEGQAEVAEYGAEFTAAVDAQNALALPPGVRQALDTVSGPLKDSLSTAKAIVDKAAAGDIEGARSDLAGFDKSFKTLEDAMSAVSDAIEGANAANIVAAHDTADIASLALWGGLGLTIALAASVFFFGRRYVGHPLSRMATAMRELAHGKMDIDAGGMQRVSEIATMQGVIGVYRTALEDRVRLAEETERTGTEARARASAAQALNDELTMVVGSATRGDFSHRVTGRYGEDDLVSLAGSVNSLMETVDRGIAETAHVLSALAHTDLTKRMEGRYEGAMARLRDDTNAVCDTLTRIVEQLRATSGALKTATGEILSGANDLSERTTKQAATIEETAAAMEQLKQTVVDGAKRAESASLDARAVSKTATEGGQVMNHATEAMERIAASSSKIRNIIGLIDDIAFQTNLLALNASVEAARAGEAGKGFAVVAIEVRRLAQSAAEASSEVKALIEQSASEVSSGSKLVADAASKLGTMLTAARANADLIDGIATASREQASAIEEVNTAVRQLDEMTQHNAALVQETNAAIEQTEAQAIELDGMVATFRTANASRDNRIPVSKTQRAA